MTLILALGNSDQVIQLSDRRLSANGKPVDEESDKAGTLICSDARLLFGFTELAQIGTFKTHQWILDTLYECGSPDYTAFNTLNRFKEHASNDFNFIDAIKNLPPSQKRISILFSGYLYSHVPPLGASGLISNYQDYAEHIESAEAWSEFRFLHTSERRPLNEPFTFIQRIGIWPAMNRDDEVILRELLREQKSSEAIIGKGVDLIRSMADRDEAGGTIGKQISSICLERDPTSSVEVNYHTNVVTYQGHLPSQVVNISDTQHMVMNDLSFSAREPNGEASVPLVPKVSRRALCPCGSGKRYKNCCGKH